MEKNNVRLLLIAQMKRAIEIMENDEELERDIKKNPDDCWSYSNPNIPELKAKLREIRRDSIRLSKLL